jgi:hypothetical protein
MSSGYAMMITGGDDGSSWKNIYVGDYNSSDTASVYVTGVCCSASINDLIAGSNGSGPVVLSIAANVNGLDLHDISLTDPKPGANVMTIGRNDTLSFTGVLYIEGPHADTSTTHITIPSAHVFAMTGYHPDFDFLLQQGIHLDPETRRPRINPDTLETNVPGIYVAGVVVGGMQTSDIFIENGRFHGRQIISAMTGRGKLHEPAPVAPPGE